MDAGADDYVAKPAHPEHARHPQRRRRRAQGAEGAQRALARRLLRRRVSLAQGHRPAARHVPRRSIPTGAASSSRTRSARTSSWTSSSRLAARPTCRSTSARARRRKPPSGSSTSTAAQPTALAKERAANGHPAPYKIAVSRHRQRELGLRRQHVGRVLPAADDDPQPLRPQLQSGAAEGRRADAEDRGRARRRRPALDRVDRDDHEGVEGSPVELGHGRPLAPQLHRRQVSRRPTSRSASTRPTTR